MSVLLFSRCDLVKAAFIDVVCVAKPHLCEKPESIAGIIRSAIEGQKGDQAAHNVSGLSADWTCHRSHDWSHDSVDLQRSRCRLLLDLHQPITCTRDSLLRLLADSSMYEVHHQVLTSAAVQQGECSGSGS